MKKYLKVALIEDQINAKNKIERFDGYEVQLLNNDVKSLELIDKLNKPILTVHYPFDLCCFSHFLTDKQDQKFLKEVIKICQKYNAGIVVHMDVNYNNISEKNWADIVNCFKDSGLYIYVENSSNVRAWQVITACSRLNQFREGAYFTPLLDICHYLINQKDLQDGRNISLEETIRLFANGKLTIHFADCTGSGRFETGGIHGDNFSNNQEFLASLIKYIEETHSSPDLVLEVYENDHNNPLNAIWLKDKINSLQNK